MLRGEKLLYEYRANLRGVHYLSNRAISGGRCQCSLHLEILPQGIRVEDEDYLSCSNATPAMYPFGIDDGRCLSYKVGGGTPATLFCGKADSFTNGKAALMRSSEGNSLHLEILPQGIRVEDEDYLSCSNATPAMYPLGLMMAGAFRISSGEVLLLPCLLQSRWLYQR